MNKETITVTFVGKYGPSVNGEWYNIDQKSGLKPDQFEKGKTYDVLVSAAKTGKKYIQQIVGEGSPKVEACPDGTEVIVTPRQKAGDDKILHAPKKETKTDWDGIARGKVACAAFGDALKSPGLAMYATSREEYWKIIEETAEKHIQFTWKHQRGE